MRNFFKKWALQHAENSMNKNEFCSALKMQSLKNEFYNSLKTSWLKNEFYDALKTSW